MSAIPESVSKMEARSNTLRVLKFGGSSLGAPGRLTRVLAVVGEARQHGALALVVSAFGDTTDWLLEAVAAAETGDHARAADRVAAVGRLPVAAAEAVAGAVPGAAGGLVAVRAVVEGAVGELQRLVDAIATLGHADAAARDRVLAYGERISASVVACLLRAGGTDAVMVDARTWLVTDDRHGDASALWEPTAARLRALARDGRVAVHTGFTGTTLAGRTTTLGRNGSDYTAALLARGLGAAEVVVYTDVLGVLTADPGLVREAYPVPALSYGEALELAGLGLRMLHPRTMVPLLEAGIPMRVRDIMRLDAPGTLVSATGSSDVRRPTCVTSLEGVCLLDVEGTQRSLASQLGARVGAALARVGVPVWFETQAPRGNGVALVVSGADGERALQAVVRELDRELTEGAVPPPRAHAPVTLLTLVAEAMGRTANVAGRFFGALGTSGINVRAASQGATSRAISAVVDADDTAVAVRAVHAAFNLADEQVSLLVLGRGTVGGQLVDQLATEAPKLKRQHGLDLRLVGLAALGGTSFDEHGLDPVDARRSLAADGPAVTDLLTRLARLPVPVLVDCTAADGMEDLYEHAFSLGIHVVTANKKVLTLPTTVRARLFAAAHRAHRAFRYETTVGAGLPVIETLKNLVRTGDEVHMVEASLSGTLGFLANQVMQGQPLAAAVREAQALGYTEPHPRDDLSGTDAARKCLILARELGLEIELADVSVEPFVPASLLAHDDLDSFYLALAAHQDAFGREIDALRAGGQVLRYLASIRALGDGRAALRVGPVGVPADHPATRLRGAEAFVAFTTARYSALPIVVQGAGAGGAVTAAGVLADVLALSQTLRGR